MKVNWKVRFKFVKSLRFSDSDHYWYCAKYHCGKGNRKQLRGSGGIKPTAECKESV